MQALELKNSINTQSNEKFKEIEEKLKMLTEKESTELKEQLKEKEASYIKLEEEFNEINKTMTKVPEEIKKREEAIEYLKNQVEQKEKVYNEDIRILSSMYYRLSFQCTKYRLDQETQKLNSLNN